MKKICFIIILLFIQSYAFASYYVPDVDKSCKLESYNKLVDFIKKCGINERIANEEVFLDKKFTGKYPTPLYLAAAFNDLNMVKKLVAAGAEVNAVNYFPESSALIKAVENNNIEMVKFLLKNGADINLTTPKYDISAIDMAQNYEMTKLLVDNGAEINKINGYSSYTPLQHAVELNNIKMVDLLINKSNINKKEHLFGKDALYFAVKNRNMEIIDKLINAGAKLTPDEFNWYKLSINNEDILTKLSKIVDTEKKEEEYLKYISPKWQGDILRQKIKKTGNKLSEQYPEVINNLGDYVLYNAGSNGVHVRAPLPYSEKNKFYSFPYYEKITGYDLEEIKRKYYDETIENFDGEIVQRVWKFVPVEAAVTFQDHTYLKQCLEANYLTMYVNDNNLFSIAILQQDTKSIDLLMKYGYSDEVCTPPLFYNVDKNSKPLKYSCIDLINDILSNDYMLSSADYKYYETLRDKFIDYDKNGFNYSLEKLINSKFESDNEITEDYLMELVSNKNVSAINITDGSGRGILHFAFEKNYNKLSNYLILHGYDIYDNYYRVPLEYTNNNKYIEQLLKLNVNMYTGESVAAAVFNNVDNIDILNIYIKYGLDVNVRGENDKPLLFAAAESGNLESVKLLIEHGAHLDDLYNGKNIIDYCENLKSKNKDIIKYLKKQQKEKAGN